MTKNERIKELLLEKRNDLIRADTTSAVTPNGLCFDGIICEDSYDLQPKKLMFLLKETNGNDSKGNAPDQYQDWDYRAWLEYQQCKNLPEPNFGNLALYRTFYNLGIVVDVFYGGSGSAEEETVRKNLGKTAIVNLKKTWGSASTPWKSLNQYLQNDTVKETLLRQIDIIKPAVVVCGGKTDILDFAQKLFVPNTESSVSVGTESIRHFKYHDIIFVDFYHPSCRKGYEFMRRYSKEVFASIKNI